MNTRTDQQKIEDLKVACLDYFADLEKIITREINENTLDQLMKKRDELDLIIHDRTLKLSDNVYGDHLTARTNLIDDIQKLEKAINNPANLNLIKFISEFKSSAYVNEKLKNALACYSVNKTLLNCLNNNDLTTFNTILSSDAAKVLYEKCPASEKFLKAVGHILASVFTLGIYAGVQAVRAYSEKGTACFWKPRAELSATKFVTKVNTIAPSA